MQYTYIFLKTILQQQSTEILTQEEFKDAILLGDVEPFYETYFAFPKIAKDCRITLNMDREWQWHHTPTYIPGSLYVGVRVQSFSITKGTGALVLTYGEH